MSRTIKPQKGYSADITIVTSKRWIKIWTTRINQNFDAVLHNAYMHETNKIPECAICSKFSTYNEVWIVVFGSCMMKNTERQHPARSSIVDQRVLLLSRTVWQFFPGDCHCHIVVSSFMKQSANAMMHVQNIGFWNKNHACNEEFAKICSE